MSFDDFKKTAQTIHAQLHSVATTVNIEGSSLKVQTSVKGCRYITWRAKTFIQQDPEQDTALGSQAKQGSAITRIIRPGKRWGYITNNTVYDPLEGV
jgi:hypothetical protein